jgi:SAM-dependent methyltransferase
MPNESFWRERFQQLGENSVGPGDTQNESALEEHRQYFVRGLTPFLPYLNGSVLDFGCGVGRWVPDLPRPYTGLDLLPEHLEICRNKYKQESLVKFRLSTDLTSLPDKSFKTIFTCTVLQHIVEKDLRKNILSQFRRLLTDDGIFLAVEWSEGQRQYDWCQAVTNRELKKEFSVKENGKIIEAGRQHTIWLCSPKPRWHVW